MKKQILNIAFILATAGAVKAQVSFAPAVNYVVGFGSSPYSVFSADFNGDGKMDLVTANASGNNVSILLGSGTGTFAAAVNYAVGSGPQAVFSADFNGDGKMDVAAINSGDNTVSILLGSGTGTFAAAVNYAAGSSSNALYSADFNGDGKMDLVTANYGSNNVSVLLGSGTGTFAAAVNYSVGSGPQGVFSADFNGDGKMDLATANFNSNNISILLGSGTGTFAAAVNYAVLANPEAVFSADFNGDGKMDLAVVNLGSDKVSVLLGNGTGTFAAAVNYTVGSGPISVFSADFNGDGKMDLATANQSGGNVSVLLGSGSGTFATAINYAIPSTPMCIFSADFNGDGKLDLSVANQSTTVSILLNTSTFPSGAALNFDGTNDFVNIPNNSSFSFGTNDFTIETYAKTSSASGVHVMIGKYDASNNYWLGVNNGKVTFSMIGGGNVNGAISIADNNWHHIAVVRQNGVVSLYIDGVLDASGANAGTATISGNLTLGNFNGGYNFPGSLDEVRIWNRALCKGEILNNKNAELPSSQTGLVAYYKFNQGFSGINNSTVTSLTDLSGNANNGTLNNFALSGATSNWLAPGAVTSGSAAPAYTPVSASVSSQTNVSCNGGSNGSIDLTPSGGNAPYTFVWSNTSTSEDIAGLAVGVYSVTVTDANACKATQTATLTQPDLLGVSILLTSDITCYNANDGALTAWTLGGTTPYTFLWNTGATTGAITNLGPGTYTVTVTDANGCTSTNSRTLVGPFAINISVASATNVSCNGGADGSATLNVTGGGVYDYDWSPGDPTGEGSGSVTGLTAGTWTCTVSEVFSGCSKTQSITITEPTAITSSQNITLPPGGTLTVGSSTYTTSGTYIDVLTAANGCDSTVTTNLTILNQAAALHFDGANDHVTVPYNSAFDFGMNDFTIETWAKTTSITGNQVMIGRISTGNYWLGVSNGKANFSMTGNDVAGTSTIGDGNWHHIAAVRKNGIQYIYVDGVLEGTQNTTASGTFAGDLTIGKFGGGFNFAGSLDEIRIWNRALCSGEILNNMNSELSLPQANLAAYYKFNQGIENSNNSTITTLADSSGNTNNGTLTNFALAGTATNWVYPGAVTSGVYANDFVPASFSQTITICSGQSITVGTNTYTTGGTYTDVLTAINGCDSTVTTNLTVNQTPQLVSHSGSVVVCGNGSTSFNVNVGGSNLTYEWYFESWDGTDGPTLINGTYGESNFNTNQLQIDSVITNNWNQYGVYAKATDGLTGCYLYTPYDSITVVLKDTTNEGQINICNGSLFNWHGVQINTAGVYYATETNSVGCDSVFVVEAIFSSPLDNTTSFDNTTATISANLNGASYQWIDCDNANTVIAGETNQSFTATANGNYAVVITSATCSDTSDCVAIASVGLKNNAKHANLQVYPNPSNGKFIVEGLENETTLEVIDVIGQVVYITKTNDTKTKIDLSNQANGVYYLKTKSGLIQKLIKQD
jgi:hypothetical protein